MLSEIAAIYKASKKKKDINLWTEYVCRPPAAALIYWLKDTPITPNQVTFLSLFVCAGAGAMFVSLHGYLWVLLAALVFEFSFVLDCVDGQLARLRGTTSILGHLLDFLMDEIKAMLVYGCVGVHMYRATGDVRVLLVVVAGMFCLASGIALTSFMRRPEYSSERPTADGQPAVIPTRQGLVGKSITLLEHSARVIVHYPSYILIVAAFGRIDLYFWAYTVVNVLYLGRAMLAIFLRLARFTPQPPTPTPRPPPATPDRDS